MNEAEHILTTEVEERPSFEALIPEISARFIHLPADQIDHVIEESQAAICAAFDLDRSTLFQSCEQNPEQLLLTHVFRRPDTGGPSFQKRIDPISGRSIWVPEDPPPSGSFTEVALGMFFPWTYGQLRTRQTVVIGDINDLPAEAESDRERMRSYGTKSAVVVPLFMGERWLGCITFATVRERRDWSTSVVRCFEFLANVFAHALARKRCDEQLRESEERFRTLVEQAGDGFELLDASGKYLDVNAATVTQLGYTREEMLRLSLFDIDPSVGPEKFAQLEQRLRQTSPFRVESLHRRKDGTTFPVEVTISAIQLGGKRCYVTLVRDITERKLAEKALTDSYAEIKELKEQLQIERDYLRAEIKVTNLHGEILGHSDTMQRVLQQVEQVAPADCTVLISGETGTGKELIAQEIHRLSSRKDRMMVLVNCAALPSALVESELFGRERGAYTGALTSQVGRFEIANGSTIFLDEVGELSMEVQAKLLRVLQQGEFQRLGSPKNHKVNVRVLAATNRDLAAEVRKGRFREDLFYRLRVFPIAIPPLRERVEDIPSLVFAFMEEFSTRMGKRITKVPRKSMEALQKHPWPGNVRELRNVIEHSVILSPGEMLKVSFLGESPTRDGQSMTLAEAEREHILKVLESTGWRIKGPHGAAQRLDLQPSTLYSRMQKLGIPHRRQKDQMASEGPSGDLLNEDSRR